MTTFEGPEAIGSTAVESGGASGAPSFGWRRITSQIALLAIRTIITLSKLLLAVYTARYLGLADLGIYGLLVAGTTIVPAVAGLGMTDWIVRKVVDLPRAQALPLIAGRSTLTLSIHAIVQPLLLALDVLLGEPIQLRLAVMAGLILMLENLGSEASDLLIARRHILLSNLLTCVRMGIWPLVVVVIGLLYPQTRSLDALLLVWIAALVVNSLILLILAARKGRWRYMRPQWTTLVQQLRYSRALYLKDVSATTSIFVDRFVISTFLSLELTGVYTFYWSVANVMHLARGGRDPCSHRSRRCSRPDDGPTSRSWQRNGICRSRSVDGRCCCRPARSSLRRCCCRISLDPCFRIICRSCGFFFSRPCCASPRTAMAWRFLRSIGIRRWRSLPSAARSHRPP